MKKQARDRERSEIFMMLENHTLKKELPTKPYEDSPIILQSYNTGKK